MRSDSWQIEKDFVPATLEEAAELRRALVDRGLLSPAEASGLVGWQLEKAFDGVDHTSKTTRAKYRKALKALNGSYPGPGPRKRVDVTPPLLRRRRSALRAPLAPAA